MLLSSLCLPALMLAPCSPPAQAGQTRQDADGYPCAATRKLTIRQDGPGFSIHQTFPVNPDTPTRSAEAVVKAVLAIGAALKIDRDLVIAANAPETADAPRR